MAKRKTKPKKAAHAPVKRVTAKRVQATENKPFVPPPAIQIKPEDDSEEACGSDGLNVRRRMFVEYITGPAFGNASMAAKMAGYSDSNRHVLDQTASRLLTYVEIQIAIRERLAAARMSAEGTRNAIGSYAMSSMDAFLSVGSDGEPLMDWKKAAACGAIGHVKEFREEGFRGADGNVEIIKRSFKIRDPMPALSLLARMHGLVSDVNTTVSVSVNQISEDDLIRIATRSSRGIAETAEGEAVPDRLCERD